VATNRRQAAADFEAIPGAFTEPALVMVER
jgi:hypothetical protein